MRPVVPPGDAHGWKRRKRSTTPCCSCPCPVWPGGGAVSFPPCVAVGWVACPGWPGWVCLSRCFSPGRVWGGGVAHCWVLREQARPPCPLCGGVGAGGVSLVRVRARGHTAGFLMVLASAVSPWCFRGRVGWGVGFWVGGLVGVGFSWGVCELDSGCEHLGAARRGVASCFLVFVLWCFDAPGRCVARGPRVSVRAPCGGPRVCGGLVWLPCAPSLWVGVCK